jgi:hypothetical protein
VTFDLIGLPPTPDDVEHFVADRSPVAYGRLLDRLLASPHYGERWGRYWLDLARYADTKGYVYDDREESRFPFAYTYRDYVINAFNEDKRYDAFIREQVAADQFVDKGARDKSLAALGFLTLGRRFLGNPHDIIDDRLDVLFRGTQALSVSCARCHDHKYDPIPTEDYYSLYGVFSGTTERTVRLGGGVESASRDDPYEKGLSERREALEKGLESKRALLSDRLRSAVGEYLIAVLDAERLPSDEHYLILGENEINPLIVHRWKGYLLQSRDRADSVFGPWHAFAAIPEGEYASKSAELSQRLVSGQGLEFEANPHVVALVAHSPPASMSDVAKRYGELLADVNREWKEVNRTSKEAGSAPPVALPDPNREELRQVLYSPDSPATVPQIALHQVEAYFPEKVRVELGKLAMEIDRWNLRSPDVAPHALILEDAPNPRNARVFLRGNPKTKGAEAPRRFLRAVSGSNRSPFHSGSGRRELAECIASANNPLTARVMVNRIWMHHFGEGIVRTPSDFGTRGDRPTHPELLDWLANVFVSDGWSIKSMHRRIMSTSVYMQGDAGDPKARVVDPENRLLARANRRRLDWEALRDALLSVTGRLEPSMSGRPVPLTSPPYSPRRTVYGFIDRRDLPGAFRIFNLASPDQHTPRRHNTTIPQQALFLMNHPFVVEQARALAARSEVASRTKSEEQVEALYRLVLARRPSSSEELLAARFVAENQPVAPEVPARSPWQYGCGTYDALAGRLSEFEPLGVWTGASWRAGPAWPDSDAGLPALTRDGGQSGRSRGSAAVRRWRAPAAGVYSISGKIRQESKEGDGILAAIVASRGGQLGRWEVHARESEASIDRVTLEVGDTLDFLVTGRENHDGDTFAWSPVIQRIEPAKSGDPSEWRAERDFAGPSPRPLSSLEEFAQALLLSNEFTFVD